jgi:hypothetical protein
MSIITFTRKPEVRALFDEFVGKTKPLPKIPIKAPPLTENYQKVGTAFDYLLRLRLQQKFPHAKSSRWIAEKGLDRIPIGIGTVDGDLPDEEDFREVYRRKDLATEYAEDARVYARAFLRTGNLTDDLLIAMLRLSDLDAAFRVGCSKINWTMFGGFDPKDVEDLRALFTLAENVDFRAEKGCILNPTFNDASMLVGGADADIILDSTIIDIKTTKDLRLERRDLYQLLGYYLLLRLDGVCTSKIECVAMPFEEKTRIFYEETISPILNAAIYFPRYGYLHSHIIEKLIPNQSLNELTLRFVELACPAKPKRQKYWRQFQGTLANSIRESVPPELTTKIIKTKPSSKKKTSHPADGAMKAKKKLPAAKTRPNR